MKDSLEYFLADMKKQFLWIFLVLNSIYTDMDIINPIIIECTIGPYPKPMPIGMLEPMPKVKVQFNNGQEKVLFEFFPDEINFTESEFIGLTEDQAHELRMKKDIQYLQS